MQEGIRLRRVIVTYNGTDRSDGLAVVALPTTKRTVHDKQGTHPSAASLSYVKECTVEGAIRNTLGKELFADNHKVFRGE
jgi:hypothetical protein